MCGICGCGEDETRISGHEHRHGDDAAPPVEGPRQEAGTAHAPGMDGSRRVRIEQDILARNNAHAQANRAHFRDRAMLVLNLVSSPGSGKTTLLTRTLTDLRGEFPCGVIEGDQATAHDAERIRATGVPAIQINTGKACHLDAHMVGHAVEDLAPERRSVLFIENVGNLVCPAAFDLGEAYKVVVLSVTEGDDKPAKYPDMFRAAQLLLLNKIDLLPHVDFDTARCLQLARQINPDIQALQISSRTGEGMNEWYRWLRLQREIRLIGPGQAT